MKNSKSLTMLPTQSSLQHALFTPAYAYTQTDHSHAHGFFNVRADAYFDHIHQSTAIYEWLLFRKPAQWPAAEQLNACLEKPVPRPHASLDDWQVWFVGHATVLVQIGPYHFLTDPVWAERVSPFTGLGPKRVRPAGIALDELPPIDAVLLSHNHYDHLDLASLEWLYQRDRMPIYTGLANGCYLPEYMQVIELDWWQQAAFAPDPRIRIAYTPAHHFSGRGLKDRNKALWGGLSILTPDDHCFFAGDTGYASHFKQIRQRLGAPRLALLPIGAYEPRQLMRAMHMNPADAVQAHLDLQAKQSLSIHYRTFQLTDEAINQPLIELACALTHKQIFDHSFFNLMEGHGRKV
ncbi:MBL fold metallo-hydrolase [Alkanindiges sp. WGS2144]|uniref:MBL fold metallo-hydrolase n=1 Tax=Alkanindiges sp. WGS2144 TaxID=3366808 RepID=UPI003753E4CF